jgi:hypothetical protein
MRRTAGPLFCVAALVLAAGCSGEAKKSQLSGKVTFNGKPVPAGYISFMPDANAGNTGAVRVAQIKDGVYDTSAAADPGISPGPTVVRIAGFNGKAEPGYPQGKQIFNPIELRETIADGTGQKDFEVPAAAAKNLKFEPTADIE